MSEERKNQLIPMVVVMACLSIVLLYAFFALPMVKSTTGFGYIKLDELSGWILLKELFNKDVGGSVLTKIFFGLVVLGSLEDICSPLDYMKQLKDSDKDSLEVHIIGYVPVNAILLIIYRLLYMNMDSVKNAMFQDISFGSGWTLMLFAMVALQFVRYLTDLKISEALKAEHASRQPYMAQDAVHPQPQGNQESFGYCPQCGGALPQELKNFCPHCGAKIR